MGGGPRNPEWFREDFHALLELLRERRIHPVVAERVPLTDVRRAHKLLEESASLGKLVLVPSPGGRPVARYRAAAHRHRMIRRVLAVRGQMRFVVDVAPRVDYARASHEITPTPHGALFESSDLALRLSTGCPLESVDGRDIGAPTVSCTATTSRGRPDGLDGEKATFSLCSFWWVEALARAGRLDEARLAFEKMLTHANHVGLYSEEIGPTGEQLGNSPRPSRTSR